MEMSYDQYISNPMAKHNSVISNRELYRTNYTDRLNKILVRENGKIEYQLFKDKHNYYCYLKIPSEVVEKFYYDVVIEFRPTNPANEFEKSVKKYAVRFYSNDPSFVFTFTHAFVENDLFIKQLSSKMSKKALKERGVERNPQDLVGYVKSLYFAYLYMVKENLFSKVLYDSYGKKMSFKYLSDQITDADTKIEDRQAKQPKKEKKEKEAEKTRLKVNIKGNKLTGERVVITKTTKPLESKNVKTAPRSKVVKRKK